MSNHQKAVFLDRDGTINEEIGYLSHPDQLRLYERAAEAIRLINERGWRAIMVTNQSGIARGLFDEPQLAEIHHSLAQMLAQSGAHLDAVYYCPHHPEAGEGRFRQRCSCRKPQPGLLRQAARDFGLDLTACAVIGDRLHDIDMAHRAGARGVLVLTGYGRQEYRAIAHGAAILPDYIAADIYAAAGWVIDHGERD